MNSELQSWLCQGCRPRGCDSLGMAGKVPLGLQRPDHQRRLAPGWSCWGLTDANQPPPLGRKSFHQVWDTGYTGKHSSQQRRKGKETYPRKKEKHMAIEKEFCGLRGEDCFTYQENSARHKEPLLVGCCQPCLVYTRILLRNKAGNGEGEISGPKHSSLIIYPPVHW